MKKEKPELDAKKPVGEQAPVKNTVPKKRKSEKPAAPVLKQVSGAQAPAKSAEPKKKKKEKLPDAPASAAPKLTKVKVAKVKAEKSEKAPAKPKDVKSPKDDKPTKFMVSMKKSVRKSLKKEAAEVGVSMNEYIVSAVVEKLGQNP